MVDEKTSLLSSSNRQYDTSANIPKDEKKKSKNKDKDKEKSSQDRNDSDDEDMNPNTDTLLNEEELLSAAKSKYDMKNHMANERTFFKYLFTGLHLGSIGTLVLNFFPNDDIVKLYLVAFIWIIAFTFMFWGLYSYYHRKYLMETGLFRETQLLNPHMPLIISALFFFVVILVVCYALFAGSGKFPGLSWGELLTLDPKTRISLTSKTIAAPPTGSGN